MNIDEKQQMLNAAFMKMSDEAQNVVLKFVVAFAEKHPKRQHLKLVEKNKRLN